MITDCMDFQSFLEVEIESPLLSISDSFGAF